MIAALNKRLSRVEEISARREVGTELDRSLPNMGTSRAELLADFGSLSEFRDWLAARAAAQAGVPIVSNDRQWQGDGAVSAKGDAILEPHGARETAAPAACFPFPTEVRP